MVQYRPRNGGCTDPLCRRSVLVGGATAVSLALAGCLGGRSDSGPAAVSLPDGAECDSCGMVIDQHPGPNGQVFYESNEPDSHPAPFRYDSLKQCLFPALLEAQQLGWSASAVYVTDYSSVDYTLRTEGGTRYISSHTAADSFAIAQEAVYVVDSRVEGAMGADFIPFTDRADATAFADENGGTIVEYDDIDEGMIGK